MKHDIGAVPKGDPAVSRSRNYGLLSIVAGGVVAIDQVTKSVATHRLQDSPIDLLGGTVTLDYARNTGAAFSIFRSGDVAFAVIAILVCCGIVVYYQRAGSAPLITRIALGLILGGAVGNLVDRVRLGYVVDFIDLHWWPVFNVADSSIVVGVLLLAAAWNVPRPNTNP